MGHKPEAGGAEDKRTDPAQSALFIEAARQAGVDESGEAFEQAFQKLTQMKRLALRSGRAVGQTQRPEARTTALNATEGSRPLRLLVFRAS